MYRLDFPTKDDKIQMARAIVTTYPILKSDTDLAYVSILANNESRSNIDWGLWHSTVARPLVFDRQTLPDLHPIYNWLADDLWIFNKQSAVSQPIRPT